MMESKSAIEAKASSVVAFMRNLDKIQEQQILFTSKLEKEKKRKEELDERYEASLQERRVLQDATRNGTIVNEDSKLNRVVIVRLEKKLQSAKIKYSVARRDNASMKSKIDSLRKDKMILMQIKTTMEREIAEGNRRMKSIQRETLATNNKRHNVQISIANAKHSIVRDMEEFSREVASTKENISASQSIMFNSIKERMEATFAASAARRSRQQSQSFDDGLNGTGELLDAKGGEMQVLMSQLQELMRSNGFTKVRDFIADLELSEDQIFNCYNDIQEKNLELEQIDLENKRLEQQLSDQMSKLDALEKYNSKVRQELELHIGHIQKSIAMYDADYAKSLEVLNTISDSLIMLLKNVTIEGEALDQQILSTGITDRNIDDYLGIIEQRIDDLIQMSNAANHNPLPREDFLRLGALEHRLFAGLSLRAPPTLPSLLDGDDDDDLIPFGKGFTETAVTNTTITTAGGGQQINNGYGSPSARDGNSSPAVLGHTISAHGGAQNGGTGEDAGRIQPINIGMLKEYMQKRMSKAVARKQTGLTSTIATGNTAGNATNLTVTVNSPVSGAPSPRGPSTKRPFINTQDSPSYD